MTTDNTRMIFNPIDFPVPRDDTFADLLAKLDAAIAVTKQHEADHDQHR